MRSLLAIVWAVLLAAVQVQANVKGVVAHFMVSNTASYTVADWQNDMVLAASAKIDGFALNIAVNESTNGDSLSNAFVAANNLASRYAFKLFLSFDYAGNGLWPKDQVITLIKRFQGNAAYYRRGSQPLVSTFEGPAASGDWTDIKAQTGCFFIPDWSSLGARPAWAKGTADGLFSWAAWPTGPNDMSTFTDASYLDTLGDKPYMMGVSPWFYTNLPGFRKNWLWRGDTLWFDRWINVLYLQPEYVQIITWNDYGESHYIGPLNSKGYEAFGPTRGRAPFNFVLDKPHDGWRMFLPYLIDMAKTNRTSFSQEMATAWYRLSPRNACGTGGTTGNTASQLQQTYSPGDVVQDKIFYAAILGSAATVSVTVGGAALSGAKWTYTPSNNIGLYRGSVAYGGATGNVVVTIKSSAGTITINGKAITSSCSVQNWNANVEFQAGRSIATTSPLGLDQTGCTSGTGDPKYQGLCDFACKYDYCPRGACTCTSLGTRNTLPKSLDRTGCPAPGIDTTFLGLCSFGCNYGWCPSACKIYPAGTKCTAPLPTAPPVPVCVAGYSEDKYSSLCAFSCAYGFCPPEICTCSQAGTSTPALPADSSMTGAPRGAYDYGLCAWTCKKGKCPTDLCACTGSGCSSSSGLPLLGQPGQFYVGKNLGSRSASQCQRMPCADQTVGSDSVCPNGQVKIGWDKSDCAGANSAQAICCSAESRFTRDTCLWRGNPSGQNSFCNGQCLRGEVAIMTSKQGGYPTSNSERGICLSGKQTFCCQAQDIQDISDGCYWAKCTTGTGTSGCMSTDTELLQEYSACFNSRGKSGVRSYCCPKSTPATCRWTGANKGPSHTCYYDQCASGEIEVGSSRGGSPNVYCSFGEKERACCKANAPPPVRRNDNICRSYDFCEMFPEECYLVEYEAYGLRKRIASMPPDWTNSTNTHLDIGILHSLQTRTTGDPFKLRFFYPFFVAGVAKLTFEIRRRSWPGKRAFITTYTRAMTRLGRSNKPVAYVFAQACGYALKAIELQTGIDLSTLSVEHVLEQQLIKYYFESLQSGQIRDTGISFGFGNHVSNQFLYNLGSDLGLPPSHQVTPPSGSFMSYSRSPDAYIMDGFGSSDNVRSFVMLEQGVNGQKGRFFQMRDGFGVDQNGVDRWAQMVLAGVNDAAQAQKWSNILRDSVSVFVYLNDPLVWAILLELSEDVARQLNKVGFAMNTPDLGYWWKEFLRLYLPVVDRYARNWMASKIADARFLLLEFAGSSIVRAQLAELAEFERQIPSMRMPGYAPYGPPGGFPD